MAGKAGTLARALIPALAARQAVVLAHQMLRQGIDRLLCLNGARSASDAAPLQPPLRDVIVIPRQISTSA